MWEIRAGEDGAAVQLRTTANQFGARDMEIIPGNDQRVTMVEDGNHEDWYLVPAQTAEESQNGLQGCFQDCSTDSEGNSIDRVCDDIVSDVQTVEQCQAQCTVGGYAYMGMACPRAGAFECWCCNDLDQNSGNRHSLIPTSECNGGELTSGVNGNRHDHCSGLSGADDGGYVLDGYYLGGYCRAAIYSMEAQLGDACDQMDPSSYTSICSDITEWHASIDMSGYTPSDVCNVQVSTGGTSCRTWCAAQGMECHHAQDNAGGGCDLGDHAMHERQSQDANGCDQNWGDQICGCSPAGLARPPPPPPPLGRPPESVPFDGIEKGVCYTLRSATLPAVMHESSSTGDCHGGNPIYAQTDTRADSFRFLDAKTAPDGGQYGNPGDTRLVSIESCTSPGRFLRHCNYHIWAGDFGTGPGYDFQWQLNEGPDGTIQIRTTSHGARDMEIVPGSDHRVTMVENGDHENWYLIPAHSEQDAALGLVGCYQDCSTDSEGNGSERVCDDIVADVQSVEDCQSRCAVSNYAFMGLACPRASVFECWCCNELDQNTNNRHSLIPTSECNGGELTSGVNGNRHDHCSGFDGADNGGYVLDGYYLGGHCRAAIYSTARQPPPAEATDITLVDLHTSNDCGPRVVANPTLDTPTNCDRDYTLGPEKYPGDGITGFADFFQSPMDSVPRQHLTLIQDSHDPTDLEWAHDQFATISIPAGATATVHCFIPIADRLEESARPAGCVNGAASFPECSYQNHGFTEPNLVDLQGGWRDTGQTYDENNGVVRQRYTKRITGSYTLYHQTSCDDPSNTADWCHGYVFIVELKWSMDDRSPTLEVIDLHTEGGGCGPELVEAPTVDSLVNCDRGYKFGCAAEDLSHTAAQTGGCRNPWSNFFDNQHPDRPKYLYLVQDAHDPTDNSWAHNLFASIRWPWGATAVVSCFVPISDQNGNVGGAHANAIEEGGPNIVDPAGGWTDTGETFDEGNGVRRQRYTKTLSERQSGGNSYSLYHTTDTGWGYVYVVELIYGLPPMEITITDLHTEAGCGPVLVPAVTVQSLVHCDRDSYIFDEDTHSYTPFFEANPGLALIQDAHDPNDRDFAHGRFVEVNIPSGATATFFCLVPIEGSGGVADGHSHTEGDYPNEVDPLGGWEDTGESYRESNGILRKVFKKVVTESFYILYHTTHL